MRKILINFAHPAKSKSKINVALLKAVESLDNVTINDLYNKYPDFMIDVKEEQRLCEAHDVILFQHPFYWYQAPAIVKEWLDLVLEHGWAYGSKGNALKGKIFMQALSAGGDDDTYSKEGYNKYSITELTTPFIATANLCKMEWIPPFTVMGVHRGLPKEKIAYHSENYRKFITALRDEHIDVALAKKEKYCNSHLDKVIEEG